MKLIDQIIIYKDFLNIIDRKLLIKIMIESPVSHLRYIDNWNESEQEKFIKRSYMSLKFIKNPAENVVKKTLEINGIMLKYVKKPTVEMQEIAIKNYKNQHIFVQDCITKITDAKLLHKMLNNVQSQYLKELIKKSPYWKDDANLILEAFNE